MNISHYYRLAVSGLSLTVWACFCFRAVPHSVGLFLCPGCSSHCGPVPVSRLFLTVWACSCVQAVPHTVGLFLCPGCSSQCGLFLCPGCSSQCGPVSVSRLFLTVWPCFCVQVLILYFQPSVFRCILLRWVRLLGFATVYGTLTLKLYR